MADNAYATLVTNDTPEGFWSLGEFIGTTAFDTSGNSHNGTYSGSYSLFTAGIVNGYTGRSVTFTNSSIGGVTMTGYNPYSTGSKRSFEGWFQLGPDNSGALTLFAANGENPTGNVSGATNATPIVVTTSASHTLTDGDCVIIASVGGNTAANGTRYVDVLSATTYALYSDAALTSAVAGNGAYTSGGTWKRQPHAPHPTQELFHASSTGYSRNTAENSYLRFYRTVNRFPLSWMDLPSYRVNGFGPTGDEDLFRMNRAHHYVFTWDDTNGIAELWVDGRSVFGPWRGGGVSALAPVTLGDVTGWWTQQSPGDFCFGYRGGTEYSSTAETYRGKAQCLAVYNRILSPADIVEHYVAGRDPYLHTMTELGGGKLHWRCDQESGTSIYDCSGNGSHATVAGSYSLAQTGLVSGSDNQSLSLSDASASSGIVGSVYKPYTTGSKRTFLAWVNPSSKASASVTVFGGSGTSGGAFNQPRPVFQWVTDANSNLTELRLWPTLNAIDYCSWQTSTFWPFAAAGATHFVVLTMDDSNGVAEVYLDGQTLGRRTATIGGNAPHWDTNDPGYFQFGRDSTGATGTNWNGYVDEVAIFERILSRREIVALYRHGQPHVHRPPRPWN